jgi:hypothetical protein
MIPFKNCRMSESDSNGEREDNFHAFDGEDETDLDEGATDLDASSSHEDPEQQGYNPEVGEFVATLSRIFAQEDAKKASKRKGKETVEGSEANKPKRARPSRSGKSKPSLAVSPYDFGENGYSRVGWAKLHNISLQRDFLDQLGTDPSRYNLVHVTPLVPQRWYTECVAFFYDFFVVGLRLPLDPFIVEFLQLTRTIPFFLTVNLIRSLCAFASLCRCLGFIPTVVMYGEFFEMYKDRADNRGVIRYSARARRTRWKLFQTPPNKLEGWRERVMWIESTHGWPFPTTNGRFDLMRSATDYAGISIEDRLVQFNKIVCEYLEVYKFEDVYAQKYVFDWKPLVSGECAKFSGLDRIDNFPLVPRVELHFVDPCPGWVRHEGFAFPSLCTKCIVPRGQGYRPKYSACRPDFFKGK